MRAAVSETFPEPNRRLLQRLVYFFFTGIYIVFEFLFSFYLMVYDPEQYILDYIPLSAQVYDQHFSLFWMYAIKTAEHVHISKINLVSHSHQTC